MFIDLDQFKVVNDSAGHQAGDDLLKQLSQDVASRLRSRDIFARLGGDEFALLLENCPPSRAEHIALDLISFIQEFRFSFQQKLFRVGASIGIVALQPNLTANELLSQADHACYLAKEKGRNTFVLASETDEQNVFSEMFHIQNITDALEHDSFEFYMQRIVPTQPGNERDYWEVLLRLRDKNGECICPGTFLPIAERFNQMQRIDKWVLENLGKQIKALVKDKKASFVPGISINLSGQSLVNKDLVNIFKASFEDCGISYERLVVEVTETAAITHYVSARDTLEALSKLGVKVALDDFGSGMASFNYIKKLPIDIIKIDGSIVKDIENDLLDATIVEAIQHIADVLDCTTVAEYVENDAIAKKLKGIGVHYLQGSYIGNPITWNEWKEQL